MEKWILTDSSTIIFIIFSTIGVYFATIFLTRIAGKRSFSKMSSFDFASTIAIGSVIASTLLSDAVSLFEGIIALTTIYVLQVIIAMMRKLKWFKKIVDNSPLLLMEGENILWANLKKANVTEGDLKAKLREANVIDLQEVRAVVFETTGDISVLHTVEEAQKLDNWLLEGVNKS